MSINLTYKTTEKKIKHYQLFNVCKTSSFLLQAKKVSFSFSKSESFLESRGESKYLHFLYTVKQKNIFRKSQYTLKQSIQIKEMQNHSTSCSLSHALMQLPTAFFIRHRVFLVSDRMKRLPAI